MDAFMGWVNAYKTQLTYAGVGISLAYFVFPIAWRVIRWTWKATRRTARTFNAPPWVVLVEVERLESDLVRITMWSTLSAALDKFRNWLHGAVADDAVIQVLQCTPKTAFSVDQQALMSRLTYAIDQDVMDIVRHACRNGRCPVHVVMVGPDVSPRRQMAVKADEPAKRDSAFDHVIPKVVPTIGNRSNPAQDLHRMGESQAQYDHRHDRYGVGDFNTDMLLSSIDAVTRCANEELSRVMKAAAVVISNIGKAAELAANPVIHAAPPQAPVAPPAPTCFREVAPLPVEKDGLYGPTRRRHWYEPLE